MTTAAADVIEDAGLAAATGVDPSLIMAMDPLTQEVGRRMARRAAQHQIELATAHADRILMGVYTMLGGK